MPTLTIEYATASERLIAWAREMICLGATLDTCERFALEQSRQFLFTNLEAAIRAACRRRKNPRFALQGV